MLYIVREIINEKKTKETNHEDGLDDVVCEFDGTGTLLLKLKNDIGDVLVLRRDDSLGIKVFIDGVLEEGINLLENGTKTSLLSGDSIDPTQGGNEIREKEGNHHLLAAFE